MPRKARDLARQSLLGFNVKGLRLKNPELAWSYDLYDQCRNFQMVGMEMPDGKKSKIVLVPYPTGYNFLPEAGGMLDQPYRLMYLFDIFLDGERQAFAKQITS